MHLLIPIRSSITTHPTPPNLPLVRGGAVGGGVFICSRHLENWYNIALLIINQVSCIKQLPDLINQAVFEERLKIGEKISIRLNIV